MQSLPHQVRQLLYDTILHLDQMIEDFRHEYLLKDRRYKSKDITKFIEDIFLMNPELEDYRDDIEIALKEIILSAPIGANEKPYGEPIGIKIMSGKELLGSVQSGFGRVNKEELSRSVVLLLNKSSKINVLQEIVDDPEFAEEVEFLLSELGEGQPIVALSQIRKNAERDRLLYIEHKKGLLTARGRVKKVNGNRDPKILSRKAQEIVEKMKAEAIEKSIKREKERRQSKGGT